MRLRNLFWLLVFLIPFARVHAQPSAPSFRYVSTDPAGACNNGTQNRYNWTNNKEWGCENGTWTQVNSGGGGGGGSPAGSAVTDAQCWASASTFGVCVSEIWTAIAAPSTPASGKGVLYIDSTSKNLSVKDDAGVVKHGIQTDTGAANNYISAVSDAGLITKSRPTCSTLSDSGTGCSSAAVTTNQNIREIGYHFDGGGTALSGTITYCKRVAFAGTITGWYIDSDVSGSATFGVKSVAFASYTGTSGYSGYADVTGGGTAPSLSSATNATFSNLTSWVTAVSANTEFCFQLSSPATLTWVNVYLTVAAS